MDKFLISAKRDGFWRAGRQWFKEPTPVDRGEFDDEQWARLEADPTIVVEPADGSETKPPADDPMEILRRELAETAHRNGELRAELNAARELIATQDATIRELEELAARAEIEERNALPERDAPPGAGSDPAPARVPTREERIRAAAEALDPENPTHWTQTGKAVILALRELSGLQDVTAAERDAAQAAAGVGPASD